MRMPVIERSPTAAGQLLIALDMWRGPVLELALIGGNDAAENASVLEELQRAYVPNRVLAYRAGELPANRDFRGQSTHLKPLFASRGAIDGQPTLYICQNFACQQPVIGAASIRQAIQRLIASPQA